MDAVLRGSILGIQISGAAWGYQGLPGATLGATLGSLTRENWVSGDLLFGKKIGGKVQPRVSVGGARNRGPDRRSTVSLFLNRN